METAVTAGAARHPVEVPAPPVPLAELEGALPAVWPTGVGEVDRVLGGGLTPGSVTLLGGEPGIGKSTLTLQVAVGLAATGRRCLLVAGEEAPSQVRARAERLGVSTDRVLVLGDQSLPGVEGAIDQAAPDAVVVDSVQTLFDPGLPSPPGSMAQVREVSQALVRLARRRQAAVILVGHVTKDGDLAGPRALEHVVDTVLAFEGDRHHALRLLRVLKHRFGTTRELGVLEMTGMGLRDVADPSGLFLADRRPGTAGSVVAPVLEGARPLLVEVQALVAGAHGVPRRSAQGVDGGRLAMLLAVLGRHAGVALATHDVYVSVAGGLRIAEPGIDLAVAVALAGAAHGGEAPEGSVIEGTVVMGEIGLGGEVRQVPQAPRRLAEAARLGFRRAVVPGGTPDVGGVTLVRVPTLAEAVAAATLS